MRRDKEQLRIKRHSRIRLRMQGTASKPRLVIHRSLKNFYVQVIDDIAQKTLFSLSTLDKGIRQKSAQAGNVKAAELLGQVFAERVREKGIKSVIFDRGGYLYHGRIKAFAEALRKAGLEL